MPRIVTPKGYASCHHVGNVNTLWKYEEYNDAYTQLVLYATADWLEPDGTGEVDEILSVFAAPILPGAIFLQAIVSRGAIFIHPA